MKITRFIYIGLAVAAISACTTTGPSAPIVDKRPAPKGSETARPKPVAPNGRYVVQRGDTLFRIAQDFNVSWQDLMVWNNIADPKELKADQVLRVVPPDPDMARPQTGSVAATSGVEVIPVPPAGGAVANKTGPRGDKKPYSEAAVTDTEKSDMARADPPKNENSNAPLVESGISWIWPTQGRVITGFNMKKKGIDIAGELGQPVVAAAAGTVQYASSIRGYGNVVILKHSNNVLSAYAHNKTILVKEGQTVAQGQKIAEMGNTDSDKVKLHFEIRKQRKPVDPTKILPSR